METKTIFSIQFEGSRYQVRELRYSSNIVGYDILQDRRVIKHSRYFTKRGAILELLQIVRLRIILS